MFFLNDNPQLTPFSQCAFRLLIQTIHHQFPSTDRWIQEDVIENSFHVVRYTVMHEGHWLSEQTYRIAHGKVDGSLIDVNKRPLYPWIHPAQHRRYHTVPSPQIQGLSGTSQIYRLNQSACRFIQA